MSETTNSMDYVAIEKAIPHRPPFLLIDRVEDIVTSERATGIKAVSGVSLILQAISQAIR